ncbi:MAG: Hsp20/alpha crystallin family protein [Deltaproteobacteria bacterium]|nr:Hsp20/alpha crystallin family protein [Deltaproteobacteria bacterium]
MAKDEWRLPFPTQLSQEVDRLFDEMIHRPWRSVRTTVEEWSPQIDLYETPNAFILEADLPGVQEHEMSVTIDNGDLLLQGQRTVTHRVSHGSFHYSERRSGSFLRRVRLPSSVDQTAVKVEFSSGVLRVTLPKLPQERRDV